MKTKIFGAFHDETFLSEYNNKKLSDYKSEERRVFVLNADYSFKTQHESMYVFGRVYSLKETLDKLKISKSISNPAEAFLIAFDQKGVESIKHFYGEFTFVYISPDKTVIGRDLMGAGLPVFYNENFFSDKLDNFKKLTNFDFEADLENLMIFLHLGHIPSPETAIKSINILPPGDYLIHSSDGFSKKTFYDYTDLHNSFHTETITIDEAVAEYEKIVSKSIKRRIDGKSNIGMLMSGGFDSASIARTIRTIYDGEINGLTIGFGKHPLNETHKSKAMADVYNIKFHETNLNGDELNEIPKIVEFLNNPFHEVGLILNYMVMAKAKSFNFDVILGGDGSDEMFGGDIKDVAAHHWIKNMHLYPLFSLYSKLQKFSVFEKNSFLFKTQFINTRFVDPYRFKSFGFNPTEISRLSKDRIKLPEIEYMKGQKVPDRKFDDKLLKAYYFKVFRHDGTEIVVFKAAAMARMFESPLTFPFADIDIYNFLKKIDRKYKITGTYSEILTGNTEAKHLQKKYIRSKLPQSINDRATQGGFIPLTIFFKNKNHNKIIYEIIKSSDFTSKFLNKKMVEKFINEFENMQKKTGLWFWYMEINSCKLINLLVLCLWWDLKMNNKNVEKLW